MSGLEITPFRFPWYVLQVRVGRELRIKDALELGGHEAYVPAVTECRKYSDRLKIVQQPLFPGYVFSRFDSRKKVPVLRVPHVMGILSDRSGPVPVPEGELDGVRTAIGNLVPWQPWPFLEVGQMVEVIAGPLLGVRGRLEQIQGEAKLIIGISLLHRALAVQIERSHVRPVSSTPASIVDSGVHARAAAGTAAGRPA